MTPSIQDTIAAISTPPGEGGIGIVRVSGPEALSIARKVFSPAIDPGSLESHKARVGKFVNPHTGEKIDEVVMLPMLKPNSFTAEDVVEFHCHGGRLSLSLILREALRQGARMAEPGEFTKRAFLNGRIDLTQAEAVISVIQSTSEGSLRAAVKQLEGGLRKEISGFREGLIGLLARVEADIDFPEDEIESISLEEVAARVKEIRGRIKALGKTYQQGRILREGVSTAIVGRPNVGKSSLLNALLNYDRAIVAEVPGTTRDIIEEAVNVRGIALNIIDTAGIRGNGDAVEMEGIRRTRAVLEGADLVLAVFDGSREMDAEDLETLAAAAGKKIIPVVNKRDLELRMDTDRLREILGGAPLVLISAKNREGIYELEDAIHQKIWDSGIDLTENVLITRMRHEEKLRKASEALEGVLASMKDSLPLEFMAADLRSALDWLGEITGESFTDEVLDRIFSEFCIGK
ncbi:MAG: tRNA uridine-5-carboxymethylaminomethyl(34) synthesis GTPase MnmE [Nitrospinae bacterium]|nr:tRNA uridine-5-carboxymethylaminomethyl(34) synthesis GTPase MnmE [Nitrospinota bacterium]